MLQPMVLCEGQLDGQTRHFLWEPCFRKPDAFRKLRAPLERWQLNNPVLHIHGLRRQEMGGEDGEVVFLL